MKWASPDVHADEHEASAADVSGLGKDDGEGESYRDGCVDCIAAGFEDFDSGVGGVVVDADDHGVLGGRGRRADDGVGIGHGSLGCRAGLRRDGGAETARKRHPAEKRTPRRVLTLGIATIGGC